VSELNNSLGQPRRPLPRSRSNHFWLPSGKWSCHNQQGNYKWKQYWCWWLDWCSRAADQWKTKPGMV